MLNFRLKRLVASYRPTVLNTLLREGEEAAERVHEEYHEADARTQQEYEDTGAAMESKRRLSDDEESELKSLLRKLVNHREQEPEVFERVVEQLVAGITEELAWLKTEAGRLKKEIVELSGEDAAVGG